MYASVEGDDRALRNRVLLAAAVYFLLHVVIRVLVSGSTELDEAEQVLLTQHLAWGYGSQPPLYTWLQSAFFHLFGLSILPLALLKNALLFSLYIFTFLTTREMTGEDRPAAAAMVSLLFIPQIAWESQRDLTHSVLGTAMMAATLYGISRVCRRGKTLDYFLFGLFAGLGVLGKYNVAVALVALFLAWLSLPEFRPRFFQSRILLSLAVFLLITGGHLCWALTHVDDTLRQAGTFQREALSAIWLDYLHGARDWCGRSSLYSPLVLVFVLSSIAARPILFGMQTFQRLSGTNAPPRSFLPRTVLFFRHHLKIAGTADPLPRPSTFSTLTATTGWKGMRRLRSPRCRVGDPDSASARLLARLSPVRRNQLTPHSTISARLRQQLASTVGISLPATVGWAGTFVCGSRPAQYSSPNSTPPRPARRRPGWLSGMPPARSKYQRNFAGYVKTSQGVGGMLPPVFSKPPPSIPMGRCGSGFCCSHTKRLIAWMPLNACFRRKDSIRFWGRRRPTNHHEWDSTAKSPG
jgi:hypothetical protein